MADFGCQQDEGWRYVWLVLSWSYSGDARAPHKGALKLVLTSGNRKRITQMRTLLYGGEEFEQVVSGADELPLPLHLLHSPE